MEPNLEVAIEADARGQAAVTIRITPDHLNQSHEFIFSIDQTYFKPAIVQCRKILSDYPIKGTPGRTHAGAEWVSRNALGVVRKLKSEA